MSQIFIPPLPRLGPGPEVLTPPDPLFLDETPPTSTDFRSPVRPSFNPLDNKTQRRDPDIPTLNDLTQFNLPPTGSFVVWQFLTELGLTIFNTSEPLPTPQTIVRLQISATASTNFAHFTFALAANPITTQAEMDALHPFMQVGSPQTQPEHPLHTVQLATWENRIDIPIHIPIPGPPANRIVALTITEAPPPTTTYRIIMTLRPGL